MKYYKDLYVIEDLIIPELLIQTIRSSTDNRPDVKEAFEDPYKVINNFKENIFGRFDNKKRDKLQTRLERPVGAVILYMEANKFLCRKAFIVLTEWTLSLERNGGLIIDDKEYRNIITTLDNIFDAAYEDEEMADFAKINDSAIKHVPKIHKLVQQEGYFV